MQSMAAEHAAYPASQALELRGRATEAVAQAASLLLRGVALCTQPPRRIEVCRRLSAMPAIRVGGGLQLGAQPLCGIVCRCQLLLALHASTMLSC